MSYLGAVDGGVVLHMLLHRHANIRRGQSALSVAQLIESGQRVEASILLELRNLVTCEEKRNEEVKEKNMIG